MKFFVTSTLTLILGTAACRAQNLEAISIHSLVNPEMTTTISSAQPIPAKGPSKLLSRTYQWSIAAIAAGTAADMASSFKFSSDGQRESNGFLSSNNGGFGGKGALIEAGLVGASLLAQHFLIKKHPGLRMPFAISNFAFAGFQAYNVHHNVSY